MKKILLSLLMVLAFGMMAGAQMLTTVHLVTEKAIFTEKNDSIMIFVYMKPPLVKVHDSTFMFEFRRKAVNEGVTFDIDKPRVVVRFMDTIPGTTTTWLEAYLGSVIMDSVNYYNMGLGALYKFNLDMNPLPPEE